ncbi:hypothetical protein AN6973.2 [Aspergillus nidulans FGSC A4]|nr:hypothetical protein AN6973.2 [Aspergillus nidulans FGSC A4]|eukprot:XP_664577.1 hypothetical protein AN6973.2 [Aspergillus nidulans FGSC A4]
MNFMNSTFSSTTPETYWDHYDDISAHSSHLNVAERLWAAWYAWMQNDVLATGIMSFVMHELVYFGRSLPWILIDTLGFFKNYKIQSSKIPSLREQWDCAKFVLLSHFTVELPQIWLFHPMAQFFGLSTSVPFPSFWTMAYQIAIFFVMEDTWHYFSHRALHWGPLYKAIHKIHHQYSAPFGMAAEYASPIEVMILGFGTVGCPIVWCAATGDLHIFTMPLMHTVGMSSHGVYTTFFLFGLEQIITTFTTRSSLATTPAVSGGGIMFWTQSTVPRRSGGGGITRRSAVRRKPNNAIVLEVSWNGINMSIVTPLARSTSPDMLIWDRGIPRHIDSPTAHRLGEVPGLEEPPRFSFDYIGHSSSFNNPLWDWNPYPVNGADLS